LVILDPPKFAHNKRQVASAARGYKDINRLAFRLLTAGGLLATFSCSGLVDPQLFQQIVFSAADDAGAEAHIVGQMRQSADHSISLAFPESAYLKGLLCRKL
jgi:23S rRNA (cytosine1962-C5)-methyltransferase